MIPQPFFRAVVLAAAILLAPGVVAAPMMAGPGKLDSKAQAQVLEQLGARRPAIGLDADHSYRVVAQHPGVQGTHVMRVAHLYKGVRIFGSESVVVLDARQQIVSESASPRRLELGRGAGSAMTPAATGFDTTPVIKRKAAVSAALKGSPPSTVNVKLPTAELVIYPVMRDERAPSAVAKPDSELNAVDVVETVDRYVLAWHVRVRLRSGEQPIYYDAIVDARTAAIIERWNMLQTVQGIGLSQYNGNVPLSTTLAGNVYQLLDPQRGKGGSFGAMAITNANHATSSGRVYTNGTNTWGDGKQFVEGTSTTSANGQTAAVNAMWGLMNTYDLHQNVLGWRALDGNDTATHIAVHVNRGYDNAYYSDTCRCMFIGDGTFFTNLGAIDVVGHEMGHGITAATSNLVYKGESGGLNESSSDIAGEVVEAYARAGGTGDVVPELGNDWMLGSEIARDGKPLRWMIKPSKDGSSRDAWSTSLKRLDVHYSSGPNNRMFYFLARGSDADKTGDAWSSYLTRQPAAMTGIGIDKAFRIWFRANTTKFTASTNYADARAKMIEAAGELYGVGSREVVAVTRAYAAINVGADIDELAAGPGEGLAAAAVTDRSSVETD